VCLLLSLHLSFVYWCWTFQTNPILITKLLLLLLLLLLCDRPVLVTA
jgi:hypothetical protein